jgi:hypothetical protein
MCPVRLDPEVHASEEGEFRPQSGMEKKPKPDTLPHDRIEAPSDLVFGLALSIMYDSVGRHPTIILRSDFTTSIYALDLTGLFGVLGFMTCHLAQGEKT